MRRPPANERRFSPRIADRLSHWRDAVREERSKPDFSPRFSHFEMFCQVMAAYTPALCEAADFFDLDLKNEKQRATLLTILAHVAFAKRPKGRPKKHAKKWSRFRLVRLAIDLEKAKRNAPNLSDKKLSDLLKKKFPRRYQHNSAEMIRQNLREARGWLDNARRIRSDRRERRRLPV